MYASLWRRRRRRPKEGEAEEELEEEEEEEEELEELEEEEEEEEGGGGGGGGGRGRGVEKGGGVGGVERGGGGVGGGGGWSQNEQHCLHGGEGQMWKARWYSQPLISVVSSSRRFWNCSNSKVIKEDKTAKLVKVPTNKGGMQNGSSVGACARYVNVFACFAPILHAQSMLVNKISASELRRKFVKNALLVGQVHILESSCTKCTINGMEGEGT